MCVEDYKFKDELIFVRMKYFNKIKIADVL